MRLLRPESQSATHQLRALATIARAARTGLNQPQRALLQALQDVVFRAEEDIEALPPISPTELAATAPGSNQALQLIRFMTVLCLADGPPSREQVSLLTDFATALGVEEPAVKTISYLAKGQLLRFRLAFLRRSHIRHYFRNTYRMTGGLLPVIKAILRFRGVLGEDDATVSRFQALRDLPHESLGYRFYRHCTDAGIAFPGQKEGFPEGAIFHDVTHVLTGYDTSAQGELKNAAFQAGYTRDNHDFFTWLIAMVLHGARINVTPFPMPNIEGLLAEEGLADCMVRELERGGAVKVDLGDCWDFWDYAEDPIEEVRARLGVPPHQPVGGSNGTALLYPG